MKIKPGVRLLTIDQAIAAALIAADRIWREHKQTLVLTGAADGKHSSGSLHYVGAALDFRTRDFSIEEQKQLVHELQVSLGADYDVALESDHIHLEYQPKTGLNL